MNFLIIFLCIKLVVLANGFSSVINVMHPKTGCRYHLRFTYYGLRLLICFLNVKINRKEEEII